MRKALVVPATTDANRGDQAIAWQTVELAKKCGFDIVKVTWEEGYENQSKRLGYATVPPLIPSPRRGLAAKEKRIHDSPLNTFALAANAVADLIKMSILYLTAPYPRVKICILDQRTRKVFEEIRTSDALIVKGGGYLHSYGGMKSIYYLLFLLFPIFLAHRLEIPVVVMPNSIGPIQGRIERWLVRQALRKCRLVTTRERISQKVVQEITGEKPKVYPDLAFGVTSSRLDAKKVLLQAGVPVGTKRLLGVTVRPWRFPTSSDSQNAYLNYLDSVAKTITAAGNMGFYPVFVSHTLGPSAHEDDRLAIEEVVRRIRDIPHAVVGDPNWDCRDLVAIYSEMDLLLATRFHSVIFAAVSGTPSLVIAYGGNKGFGIMKDMGLEEYVVLIDDLTPQRLTEAFSSCVANMPEIKRKVQQYVAHSRVQFEALEKDIRRALGADDT